ncbi:MAG: DNA photolyase [Desulfobacteraceae bacterium]
MHFRLKKALIEQDAERYALGARILKRVGDVSVKGVARNDQKPKREPVDLDKETLRLVSFQGEFLKPCPGTRGYICCGYQILNVGTNCPLDCSYCILQAYFNQPTLRVFVNLEEKLETLGQVFEKNRKMIFRLGTGEFTDSLALDPIVGWSDILLPFFSKHKNVVLELKTKTDHIERLLSAHTRERIIVSWSLNSPSISAQEEHGAPGLQKRLLAAKRCQAEGYTLGFHFDPMIQYPGWKRGYMKAVELMDQYLDPKGIIWMSLGGFRFMPLLKSIIRKRHPSTHILDGEFVPGLDGKMRYFKPIRMDLYGFMGEKLDQWHKDLGLYLCMESDEIWQKSLGWSPDDSAGLSNFLDARVVKFFGNV